MKCDELKVHKAYNRWIDEEMPTPNDDLICNEVYLKSDVDASIDELKTAHHKERHEYIKMIAELKRKLEDAKASAYAESVDAGMENRRLKRALWIARAERARSSALSYHLIESHPDKDAAATYKRKANKWEKVKDKCLKKADEYK